MSGELFDALAERSVLGSFLLDPDLIPRVEVEAEDFFVERHQMIFGAMQSIWAAQYPVDPVSLRDELERRGQLEEVGGGPYLSALINDTPTHIHAHHYGHIVRNYSRLRGYVGMAQSLLDQVHDSHDPNEVHGWLQTQLAQIAAGGTAEDAVMDLDQSFDAYDRILEERRRRAEMPREAGWDFPWPSWNRMVDQPDPGLLVTIMGGDGMGKTVVAEKIAEHWAQNGKRVAFVHFELNRALMLDRRTVRHTKIERSRLKSGRLTEGELFEIGEARQRIGQWAGNLFYVHAPGWSMEQALRAVDRLGIDAIVVDYLNKCSPSRAQIAQYGSNLYSRQADDVELLKNFGEQNNARLVMLAQLNKSGKGQSASMLSRNDGRGSGEISEKSNVVALLHRERLEAGQVDAQGNQVVEPGGYSRELKVRFDKNTMGRTGVIEQFFSGPLFDIFDVEKSA